MSKLAILCAAGSAAALLAATAQTPPPPGPDASPVQASSVALPGDMMGTGRRMGPPPGARPGARPGGPPPGGGNMHEPGDNTPGPSMALALKAAEAAVNYCKAQSFNIGVAVIDSKGRLRVGLAEDGASGGHIYTAVRKGLAAIAFGEPSAKVDRNDPRVTPAMAVMAGAIPLFSKDGKLLGAIAGSGAASNMDAECAQAGADAIKGEL